MLAIKFRLEGADDVREAIRVLAHLGLSYGVDFNAIIAAAAAEQAAGRAVTEDAGEAQEAAIRAASAEATNAETVAEAPKRRRRTKAEMEAERAILAEIEAAHPIPDGPVVADTAPADLFAALSTIAEPAAAVTTAEAPPFEVAPPQPEPEVRDALIARARERAKAVGGKSWLVEHVLCGSKYPSLSAVPTETIERALALA